MPMTVRRSIVVLCLLVCLPSVGKQVAAQTSTAAPDRTKIIAAAKQVIAEARYCTLVTLGPDGHPQSRIIDPFAPDEGFLIRFATNPKSRKVTQIKRDARVTLTYFAPGDPGYVTVLGRAEIVRDPKEKATYWKDDWVMFYKNKNQGDDYLLVRVKPFRIEVVSTRQGVMNDPKTWTPVSVTFP